ncbi:MAG: DJ-1/PfpI family protein, partial [Proteobacteria bacterium]|nr:DJ-1/PfpI family protein [Pseudomonadota bacterium]
MKSARDAALVGIVIYPGVEPIDIGGTMGVISMARRILPGLASTVIAAHRGFVQLAGGLTVLAEADFTSHPECDRYIVCGGPGWQEQVADAAMLGFLEALPETSVASICTGALILAA